jgi:hypothetical protein
LISLLFYICTLLNLCSVVAAQVIALCAAPFLLDNPKSAELFSPDAIARAKELHKAFNGGGHPASYIQLCPDITI